VCRRSSSGAARAAGAAALAVLAAAPAALGADAWPMTGHDASQTSRSGVVAAKRPALVPGWPITDAGALPALVAPDGSVQLGLRSGAGRAIIGRDGRWRRLAPVPGVVAIGPDGRLYAFTDHGDRVAAYSPAGRLLWTSPPVHLGPEASDRDIRPAPDGSVYLTGAQGVAALDAAGALRWVDPGGQGNGTRALAVAPDGAVVYGLVGLDGRPRLVARGRDGSVRFERALPGRALEVALAADGTAVIGEDRSGASGGAALVAVGADGAERWRVETGLVAAGGIALGADGTAYAVLTRGILRAGGALVTGSVMAVAPDGQVRWRVRGPVALADPVVGGDGTIYVGGAPLLALRPDGSTAWSLRASRPLVPRAIGTDGTLYVAGSHLERQYAIPDGTVLALAGPTAARTVAFPDARRQRTLIARLALSSTRFRTRGAISLCATARRCSPLAPLGATISFTLRREASVSLLVRRAADGRVVARLDRRVLAGTTWRSALDLQPLRSAGGGPVLGPGRYTLTARAATGAARASVGPIGFSVVR